MTHKPVLQLVPTFLHVTDVPDFTGMHPLSSLPVELHPQLTVPVPGLVGLLIDIIVRPPRLTVRKR